MPYYNSYPQSYLPYQQIQQPMMQQSQNQMPQNNNGINWVQGELGAKAYPVAPGANVLLMDSEEKCFYIKSADPTGKPLPLRTFTYEEVVHTQSQAALPEFHAEEYAKRAELEELRNQVSQLAKGGNANVQQPVPIS